MVNMAWEPYPSLPLFFLCAISSFRCSNCPRHPLIGQCERNSLHTQDSAALWRCVLKISSTDLSETRTLARILCLSCLDGWMVQRSNNNLKFSLNWGESLCLSFSLALLFALASVVHATKTIRRLNASFKILCNENTIMANNDVALHMPLYLILEWTYILEYHSSLTPSVPMLKETHRSKLDVRLELGISMKSEVLPL